jgi:hypothetical protein
MPAHQRPCSALLPTCAPLPLPPPTPLAPRSWRSKIDPVLKSEESRSNFDIQQYGEKIIHRLVPQKASVTRVMRVRVMWQPWVVMWARALLGTWHKNTMGATMPL